MNVTRLTILDYAVILTALAALGMSIYNMVTARKLESASKKTNTVLVAHHNILDHAEFKGLDPVIKKFYARLVKEVMPEVIAEANSLWKSIPWEYRDAEWLTDRVKRLRRRYSGEDLPRLSRSSRRTLSG